MSAPVTPSPAATAGSPGLTETQRIAYTFTAPSRTFADIRVNAKWLAPFLLLALSSYLFSFSVARKITWEQVAENQMKMAPESRQQQFEQLPPEQRARAERMNVTITKTIGYTFPFLYLVFLFVVAVILMLTFNFGLGAEVRYWQAVAIVLYASLPAIIRTFLAVGMLWGEGQDPADFNIQNAFGSNPGYYLNFQETPRFLYGVATAVDVFTIWTLALTAIGFSIVARTGRGASFAAVFGWWILATLIGAAVGAVAA